MIKVVIITAVWLHFADLRPVDNDEGQMKLVQETNTTSQDSKDLENRENSSLPTPIGLCAAPKAGNITICRTEIPTNDSSSELSASSSELSSGSLELFPETSEQFSGSSELSSGSSELSSEAEIQSSSWRRALKQKQYPWEQSGKYEGDIILLPTNRNCVYCKSHYWPKKELPYKISGNFTNREKKIIMESLTYIFNETCIKPIPRRKRDKWGLYFLNRPGHGCSTSVGFSGKKQHIINLDVRFGCVQYGIVLHEILHALGMWHEQSSPGRDKYIDIKWDNIIPGDEKNFAIAQGNVSSFGFTYDYDSIMHYSAYAFSANGKRTIYSKYIPRIHVNSANYFIEKMKLKLIVFLQICLLLQQLISYPMKAGHRRALKKLLASKQNLWERSGQVEGDILPPYIDRNANLNFYWPNKELPYEISPLFSPEERTVLMKSFDYLSNKTCVTTRPRESGDQGYIYVSEKSGHGCSSNIGYWGRKQTVYLDRVLGCVAFGIIVHELCHVLGLWHQQSAHNRDRYINILWKNIDADLYHNFDKADPNTTTSFGYKYDYNSIMHYTAWAFSKNGEKTIVPKNPKDGAYMGQRQRLSRIDIAKIKTMYKCD